MTVEARCVSDTPVRRPQPTSTFISAKLDHPEADGIERSRA